MKKFGLLLFTLSTLSFAQISLTGGPYSQNFDSYAGTALTIPNGWNVSFDGTVVYNGIGTGTSTTGGVWAYGTAGDYSFGVLRSGTSGNITLSVSFTNNTGETITDMTLQWNYEQWRYANTSGFDISGTGVLTGNSNVDIQDFVGLASGSVTNGTVTTTPISITLTGVNILDGQTFGLQWITTDVTSSDNGLSIDDFQVSGPAPLPVELTSFSASVIGSKVKLNWTTATEVNNYGFDIQRQAHTSTSLSVAGWEKIGFVSGNGNSNSPKSYSFTDNDVTYGKYIYRLKQIDNDGQYEYSKTVEVNLGAPKNFKLGQNYPNPFNPTTIISYRLPEASDVKLIVYNLLGQEVKVLVNEFKEAGSHIAFFDAENLNSGLYIYKLQAGSFTQTKKMTLIK